jgi:mRNA-degrading endonuclease toxin of MazEF toxin-antitoxin module
MTYKRGDVAIVLFPHSDLRKASRRPCLVVQQDGIGTGLPQTIVAMITSNIDELAIHAEWRFHWDLLMPHCDSRSAYEY